GSELAEAIAGLGGKLSAKGDVDDSEISATALARFWRELLGFTAELALEPKLSPGEVDGERDWLVGRIQKRRDNAPARAFDEFYAALYGAAVKVLSTVLGGGMAGRLFVELRDKRGLAYTAAAYYDPVVDPGAIVLYLGTAPENATKAEEALLREVERVRQDLVGADEL